MYFTLRFSSLYEASLICMNFLADLCINALDYPQMLILAPRQDSNFQKIVKTSRPPLENFMLNPKKVSIVYVQLTIVEIFMIMKRIIGFVFLFSVFEYHFQIYQYFLLRVPYFKFTKSLDIFLKVFRNPCIISSQFSQTSTFTSFCSHNLKKISKALVF